MELCPICNAGLESSGLKAIGDHCKSVGHFKCDQCQKTFRDRNGLNQHLAKGHLPVGHFECDQCQKTFKDQNGLNQHLAKAHLPEGQFECDKCQKTFKDQNGLNQHLAKSHLPGGQVCPICNEGLELAGPRKLGDHSMEKGHFQCADCDKLFRDQNGLDQHKAKVVHDPDRN